MRQQNDPVTICCLLLLLYLASNYFQALTFNFNLNGLERREKDVADNNSLIATSLTQDWVVLSMSKCSNNDCCQQRPCDDRWHFTWRQWCQHVLTTTTDVNILHVDGDVKVFYQQTTIGVNSVDVMTVDVLHGERAMSKSSSNNDCCQQCRCDDRWHFTRREWCQHVLTIATAVIRTDRQVWLDLRQNNGDNSI